MISSNTPLLLFATFVILLSVSISVPIIKAIYFLEVDANIDNFQVANTVISVVATVQFGVWGYCSSPIDASVAGQDYGTPGQCSSLQVGYTFDKTVSDALHISDSLNTVARAVTTSLILHPIACLVSLVALTTMILIVSSPSKNSKSRTNFAIAMTVITALLTSLALAVDIAFVVIAKREVIKASAGQVTGAWGNAVWMVLGATVAVWAACVTACLGACTTGSRGNNKRNSRRQSYRYDPVMTGA